MGSPAHIFICPSFSCRGEIKKKGGGGGEREGEEQHVAVFPYGGTASTIASGLFIFFSPRRMSGLVQIVHS